MNFHFLQASSTLEPNLSGGSISSSISAHICRQQSAATDVDDDGKGAFAKDASSIFSTSRTVACLLIWFTNEMQQ
ncbi:hypothetical protein HanXRQr2_Chr03g0091761 [Helianthus annuus]|uniref:Uncharacterized protein n=1 Tax=Helianthus annuus TaxID=4232 RepID=A0A251V4M1_HELAN|nr:hypothetical protein HanXRQr2_Chr03g0091761 [Helianthus annuus]